MGTKRPNPTFGNWLKMVRQKHGLTQRELADRMGYDVSNIQKIEQGQKQPSKTIQHRLAQALNIPIQNLPDLDGLSAPLVYIPHLQERVPPPMPLTPSSYIPLRPNPLFIGRENSLKQLAQSLTERQAVCIGQTVAATGQGGIGKTQLVVEFAHRYGRFFFGGVFWLNFAEPTTIPNEVARCGRPEHLNLSPQFTQLPLEQQVALVQRAWQEATPRLLIFDNCEDEKLLDQWRPTTGGCHILITSRCQRWDPVLGVYHLVLEVLEREQSVRLLRSFTPQLTASEAEAIAVELGDLPLALHLAGSYLALQGETISGADYLAQLHTNGRLQHPSLQTGNLSPTRHDMHVGRTFAISLAQLHAGNPVDQLAMALLTRAVHFAPGEPIPVPLLAASLPEGADLPIAITRLEKLGLVHVGEGGIIRLHQLIAEFVQATLTDEMAQTAVETALIRLTQSCNETRDLYPARNWQGHLRYVTAVAQPRADAYSAALCLATGSHLWICGDYQQSKTLLEAALNLHRQLYGNDHPKTAVALNQLGRCCLPLNQLAAGRKYQEEALVIQQQLYGQQHPLVAAAHNELALLLQEMAEYPLAKHHFERAITIRQQTLGPNHPDTGFSCLCLSLQCRLEGEYEAAKQWCVEALRIAETTFWPDHPDTIRALNALGLIYNDLGDLAAAREHYERAHRIRERVLGANHNDTLTTLNNLGELYLRMGLYDKAMSCLKQALSSREQQFGPTHKSVAQSCRFLGALYQESGDLDTSLVYLQRALSIFEAVCGTNNPALCNTLNHLGNLYREMKAWQMAHEVLCRSLAIREQVLGPTHPDTAVTLNYLGQLLVEMGDLETAQTHLERARNILRQTLTENHPSLAQNSQAMGCLMQARGDETAARNFFAQALTIRERVLGLEHPHTKESRRFMVSFRLLSGRVVKDDTATKPPPPSPAASGM